MNSREIREKLRSWDPRVLESFQWSGGRTALGQEAKEPWVRAQDFANEILEAAGHDEKILETARALQMATYSLWFSFHNNRNVYYTYADIPVLDWYLGPQRETFHSLKRKSLLGIYYLLQALIRFESDSLTGMEHRNRKSLVENILLKRLLVLKENISVFDEAWDLICAEPRPEKRNFFHFGSFEDYACEEGKLSGLLHLSCFPQTTCHDEVLFIRSLHISELCFHGLRTSLCQSVEGVKAGDIDSAHLALVHALQFAKVLHAFLKALRTMPPANFQDFRDTTEGASAIQSRGYHLMDIYFRGVNDEKMRTLKKFPYLFNLEKYGHPRFVDLGSALRRLDEARYPTFFDTARQLDRQLLTWRALHLSFAKVYSPPGTPGTGGTLGAPYLAHFLKSGLFDTTTVDLEVVMERFGEFAEIKEMFKSVQHDWSIAPSQERII